MLVDIARNTRRILIEPKFRAISEFQKDNKAKNIVGSSNEPFIIYV